MKLRILGAAFDDLDSGRMFYEGQGEGLGAYFLDSLFSDCGGQSETGGI